MTGHRPEVECEGRTATPYYAWCTYPFDCCWRSKHYATQDEATAAAGAHAS